MGLLNNLQQGEGKKQKFTLDETLAVIILRNQKVTPEEIAKKISAHTKNSVQARINLINKMKKEHGDKTMEVLFTKFKETYTNDEDVVERVEKFLATRTAG